MRPYGVSEGCPLCLGFPKGIMFPFGRGGGKSHRLETDVQRVSDAVIYSSKIKNQKSKIKNPQKLGYNQFCYGKIHDNLSVLRGDFDD